MQRIWLLALAIALGIVAAADANPPGRQVRFVGVHPIPKVEGGGICYIEGPHVHIYAADKLQYRDHDGAKMFVGDPVAYGWDGPKYAYKGHHPIHVEAVVGGDPDEEWCYIDGPHFHYFPAPEGPEFKLAGNTYFYVGTPPAAYVEARPAMVKINTVYTPLIYDRPVVAIDAPDGWIGVGVGVPGVVVEGPAVGVVAPGVAVVAPGVAIGAEIHVPMPSVHVGVGIVAPGVVVGTPGVIVEERVKVKRGRGHWK
jgi:hypothetical protein